MDVLKRTPIAIILFTIFLPSMALDQSTALSVINKSEYYPNTHTLTPLPIDQTSNTNQDNNESNS